METKKERWEHFKDGDMIVYTDEYIVLYLIFKASDNRSPGYKCWQLFEIGVECRLMPFDWYIRHSHPATEEDMKEFKKELEGSEDPLLRECSKKMLQPDVQKQDMFEYEDEDILICERTGDVFMLKRFTGDRTVEFHTCVNIKTGEVRRNGSLDVPSKDALRFASKQEVSLYSHYRRMKIY